jgi:asparagine synthase (glutamine-hydrolysing)
MVSDVPIGAFLSGGVDSSAVVAFMARHMSEPVKTFSVSYGEADFDEARFARMVAERYATEHHEFRVEPHALSILPQLARHYGEPFADPSAIPTFQLAELTGRHVTVALNGDGGDEAFAGYPRYARMATLLNLQRAPRPLRAAAAGFAGLIESDGSEGQLRRRLGVLGRALVEEGPLVYANFVRTFDATRRERLLTPELRAELNGRRAEDFLEEAWSAPGATDGVDRLLGIDIETYLPGDLLVKVDIATMAHSLEARSPFLDHRLLEFAARLPPQMKMHRGGGKRILKLAMRGIVPDAVLDRPKMGFGVPLKHWFRGELADLPRDLLLDPSAHCREYLAGEEIERLLAEHAAGQYDHAHRLWALIQLETWHREVLEPARSARVTG